jgi:hypothetical protein
MLADPPGCGEAQEEGLVEPAGAAEVEILDRGDGEAEPGELQQTGKSPVRAGGDFALDEEREVAPYSWKTGDWTVRRSGVAGRMFLDHRHISGSPGSAHKASGR